MLLTQRNVDDLRPTKRPYIAWDSDVKGFGVKVMPTGHKAFILVYRFPRGRDGKVRRYRIDAVGGLSVKEARDRARARRGDVANGIDPMAVLNDERKAARAEKRAPRTTLETIAKRFIELHHKRHNRTWREAERIIHRHIIPAWGRRQITEITRGDVNELLDAIEEKSGATTAHAVLKQIRRMFRWHSVRDERFVTPIVTGMARITPKQQRRRRVLADEEVRILWQALDTARPPFRQIVRFLLLTAQRRTEVSGAKWQEITGDVWTIPPERYKTDLEHRVPLTPAAIEQLRDLGDFGSLGACVFTTTGTKPFAGFGKAKAALDAEMLRILRVHDRKAKLEPWVLHDLRRTAKTLMQRAGVRPDISERVLGHVIPGIEGTYDQHEYLAEKREALTRLAGEVARILA